MDGGEKIKPKRARRRRMESWQDQRPFFEGSAYKILILTLRVLD